MDIFTTFLQLFNFFPFSELSSSGFMKGQKVSTAQGRIKHSERDILENVKCILNNYQAG